MENLAFAILLETIFADWCGDMYPMFRLGGNLNGMGSPRKVFIGLFPTLVGMEDELLPIKFH